MLAITLFLFSLLFSATLGVPLTQRDVFNPHITNPHNGTVWVVGSKETVTWETADIPPDSQLTSPFGRVILGHLENDSLNLQIEHPLAANFRLRSGQVTITVPDVPTRDDYIIVLMGDSGNASPTFVITTISGGSSSSHSSSTSRTSISSRTSTSTQTATLITETAPIGGSVTSIFQPSTTTSDSTLTESESESVSVSTSTTPVSSPAQLPSTTSTSSSALQTATAAPVETGTNGAWSMHGLHFTHMWSMVAAPLVLALVI